MNSTQVIRLRLNIFLTIKIRKTKKDKNLPVSKKIKSGPGSDPINKFKKGKTATAAEIDNIITGAVENVKAKSGRGLANEGTNIDYNEENY